MKNLTRTGLLAVLVASWVMLLLSYGSLPERMPVHWNLHGVVDVWGDKKWAALLLSGIITLTVGLVFVLPAISPAGFRLDGARRALFKLMFWIASYLLAIQCLTYQASLHPDIQVSRWFLLATGGLFVVVGNLLGKFPKNFFVGVRTPWTLASDAIWDKTHRLTRVTFVLAGLLLMSACWLDYLAGWLLGAALGLAVLVPVAYSFIAYRRQVGFEAGEHSENGS